MTAADRCKEHFQGDKCRRSEGHDGKHRGQFREWDHRDQKDGLPPLRYIKTGNNHHHKHPPQRGRFARLVDAIFKKAA